MNSLQGYGTDSDEEEKTSKAVSGAKASSSKASAIRQDSSKRKASSSSSSSDSEDSDAVHDADVFALDSLRSPQGAESGTATKSTSASFSIQAAPGVQEDVNHNASSSLIVRPTDTDMHVNIPYDDLTRAIQGPQNPFSSKQLGAQQNSFNGNIESASMTDFDFKTQQRTFETLGYARDPSNHGYQTFVGDQQRAQQLNGASVIEMRNRGDRDLGSTKRAAREMKKQRKGSEGDTGLVEGEGAYAGPWRGWKGDNVGTVAGPSEEELQRAALQEADKAAEARKQEQKDADARGTEKSQFHGKSMYDYQGRTYIHVPTDVDVNLHGEIGAQESFIPKACIHTWTGHTKAISALRLFPGSGHLVLSASMDCKVKLWDVYREGNCLRTFMGHSKAVKDVAFSNDGRTFLSAGYDRQMKLWDTETGQCTQAFSTGKMPYVVKFHPDPEKQHVFLAGMNDKKIVQFDIRTGELTQEYDQHLGAVNTITFVDENRRFATTSDDKTMRVWDYDIPVVIKYVADPLMHSMPAVTKHPNDKWLACQSLDNQILVYAADSFRQNRKKVFKGHNVSGYACQIGFSPDGRFISSGDGLGNLVFWDWKSGRLLKRLHGHKEVIITHAWLPHETSKVITGSWDGTMKLWD